MNHPNSPNGLIDSQITSTTCPCGSIKKENKPFCYQCSEKVRDWNQAIYFRLYKSHSLYDAYEDSIEYLKEIGEIRR